MNATSDPNGKLLLGTSISMLVMMIAGRWPSKTLSTS